MKNKWNVVIDINIKHIPHPTYYMYPKTEHCGPVRLSYNPSFSACFFSRNSIFLSQQISGNSVSTCFFSKANGAYKKHTTHEYKKK